MTILKKIILQLTIAMLAAAPVQALDDHDARPLKWRDLPAPRFLQPVDGAVYYSFTLPNGSKAHLVVANYSSAKWKFQPALNDPTASVLQTGVRNHCSAAINGG